MLKADGDRNFASSRTALDFSLMKRGTKAARAQRVSFVSCLALRVLWGHALGGACEGRAQAHDEASAAAAEDATAEAHGDAALARANAALEKRRFVQARQEALKARNLYREARALTKETEALVLLGQIETEANNPRLAVHYITQARNILERNQTGRATLPHLRGAASDEPSHEDAPPLLNESETRENPIALAAGASKPAESRPTPPPDAGAPLRPSTAAPEGPTGRKKRPGRPKPDAGFQDPFAQGDPDASAPPRGEVRPAVSRLAGSARFVAPADTGPRDETHAPAPQRPAPQNPAVAQGSSFHGPALQAAYTGPAANEPLPPHLPDPARDQPTSQPVLRAVVSETAVQPTPRSRTMWAAGGLLLVASGAGAGAAFAWRRRKRR